MIFSTEEAVKFLNRKEVGFTLKSITNPSLHVFKCIDGTIRKFEYGVGNITLFNQSRYGEELWRIDFEGTNASRRVSEKKYKDIK